MDKFVNNLSLESKLSILFSNNYLVQINKNLYITNIMDEIIPFLIGGIKLQIPFYGYFLDIVYSDNKIQCYLQNCYSQISGIDINIKLQQLSNKLDEVHLMYQKKNEFSVLKK